MENLKIVILGSLIVILFLSGCTLPTGRRSGGGVVVKELLIEPQTIESQTGQPIQITLTVKNNGEVVLENLAAAIYGLNTEEFTIGNININPRTLRPANPSLGLNEGEEAFGQGTVTYRGGPKSNSLTYSGLIRVSFSYSTVAEGIVKAVTMQYYKEKKDRGGINQFKYTSGPIKVEIVSPSSYIVSGDSGRPKIFLKLFNTGGGRPYLNLNDKLDYVQIEKGNGIERCSSDEIRIPPEGGALVSCDLSPLTAGSLFETKSFKITIKYNYMIDQPFTITVLPTVS